MVPIRIVLGEDHALVREGPRGILEQQPDMEVVGEAGDGQEALELVERVRPDILILDIRMPRLSGIEVLRQMRQRSPGTRTLLLTAYDDDDYIFAAMEAGGLGYMLKTARASELVDAVRRVHEGEPVLHPAIAAKVAHLWAGRRTAMERGSFEPLSPREREVLELAAKGLRTKAIAERLYISARTVEGHLNSIFAKLGVSSRLEAVLSAAARRLVSLEEPEEP